MKLPIKEILNKPELERLKDWASIGPVQRLALEEFIELIVQKCCDQVRAIDAIEIRKYFGK